MHTSLIQALRSLAAIPETEAAKLNAVVSTATLLKGEHFISEGTTPIKFGFNIQGLFRYYYVNKKGTEFTKGFFPEGNFVTSYTAMVQHKPSLYSIQALEDSEVAVIDYRHWERLYNGHSCWMQFVFALLQKGYMKKEARERELLLFSAEERYAIFLRDFPLLESRIRQHMIASYLGITPVALSRVRRAFKLRAR